MTTNLINSKNNPTRRINYIKRMGDVVGSWLNYQLSVSCVELIAESSIRFPIIAFLERQKQVKEIQLEYTHPKYSTRHIDFHWEHNRQSCFMELKYVGNKTDTTYERQRIFNDIVRLAILGLTSKSNNKLYFIMTGEALRYEAYFQHSNEDLSKPKNNGDNQFVFVQDKKGRNNRSQSKSIFNKMFSFIVGKTQEIDVTSLDFKKLYKKYTTEYSYTYKESIIKLKTKTKVVSKREKVNHPSQMIIRTKLIANPQSENQYMNCRVGIWEITVNQKKNDNQNANIATNLNQ